MVQKDVYSERERTYNHMDRIRLQGDDSRGECTYNHVDRISLQRDDSPEAKRATPHLHPALLPALCAANLPRFSFT